MTPTAQRVLAGLTPRQKEVLTLAAHTPLSRALMAERLGVGVETVVRHLDAVYKATGQDNRLGLIFWARHHEVPFSDSAER